MHEDEYFLYYVMSLFKEKEPLKLAQLIHVFHGRRTPSMLYVVEKHQLFSAFNYASTLSRDQLEACLHKGIEQNWLRKEEKEYYLTTLGKKEVGNYFSSHPYPTALTSLQYAKVRHPFWERFQLLSQVFSEKKYQNTDYSPVIKHPSHQHGVKRWLHRQGQPMEKLIIQWVEEVINAFTLLDEDRAHFLALQLAGHKQTGKTKNQVAEFYHFTMAECDFFLENSLECFLQIIAQTDDLFLLSSLLKDIQEETHMGVSASTYQTASYLKKGYSIQQIAKERQLKVSTIHEHLLEIAFIYPRFSYEKYVPKEIYVQLKDLFNEQPEIPYREMKEKISDLPFLYYRLVQLERMREDAR